MSKTITLNPSEIFIPAGRRDIDPETVQNLVESIETIGGLLNPIDVRWDGERYILVAGAHRLEAVKQRGQTEIECVVLDCDALRCELAEIDENLIHLELHYICDPPYGITAEEWDVAPPLDQMWQVLEAKTKAKANFVFFAAGKFLYPLINSKECWFRYDLIWYKSRRPGFLNANKQPMRAHESILVFGHPGFQEKATYNPIKTPGGAKSGSIRRHKANTSRIYSAPGVTSVSDGTVHPGSVLQFPNDRPEWHSTQKPLALMAWLVSAYSNPGDLIIDPFCGSGTTGVACRKRNRRFIGIEREQKYFDIACQRIEEAHRGMAGNDTIASPK